MQPHGIDMFYSQRKNSSLVCGTGGCTTSITEAHKTEQKKSSIPLDLHKTMIQVWFCKLLSGTFVRHNGPGVIQEHLHVMAHLRQAISHSVERMLRRNNRTLRQVWRFIGGQREGLESLKAKIKK